MTLTQVRSRILWLLLAVPVASCSFEPPADPGRYHPCAADGMCPHPDRCSCLAGWVCVPDDPDTHGPEDCFPDCNSSEQCNDLDPCTIDKCNLREGVCVHDSAPDGTACDDGDDCTEGDACRDGVCQRGDEYVCPCQRDQDCEDLDPCTRDVCDATNTCIHPAAPDGTPCEDDDPCTDPDTCQGGSCQPGPWTCDCEIDEDCDDGEECTEDICEPSTGTCRFPAVEDGTACEDDDPCTGGDSCLAGVCQPGPNGVCAAEDCDGDGFDEDGDGFTDCRDMDCYGDPDCDDSCGDENMSVITCGQQLTGDTTGAGNNLSWYSCVPWDETGGEHVYVFSADEAVEVTVMLIGQHGFDPDLFVLYPECAQDTCFAHADMGVLFYTPVELDVYLVVDGFEGEEGQYIIDVRCVPTPEICVNDVDDDLDGATDCHDTDCLETTACMTEKLCAHPRVAHCGDIIQGDTTQTDLATSDLIDMYGDNCGSSTAEAPETAWTFDVPVGATVTVGLFTKADTELGLYLLNNCDPMDCTQHDPNEVTFTNTGVAQTVLMVDGPEGGAGPYTLAVACDAEICGNNTDDDLDGFTDCADPDCHDNADCGEETGDNCVTGVDEDADGATDCDDTSCMLDGSHCPGDNLCRPVQEVGCGHMIDLNTSGSGATDVVDVYTEHGGETSLLYGPEIAVSFRPAGSGMVHWAFESTPGYTGLPPQLMVLEGACHGNEVIAHGVSTASWNATDGTNYFLVLDAPEGSVVNARVVLDCEFEDCANGVDDDNDGHVDCADTDCSGTSWCPDGMCSPGQTVVCGDSVTVVPGDVANQITYYPLCTAGGGAEPHPGGELVWQFEVEAPGKLVTITQDIGQVDSDWFFVLEDDCDGLRCVACGSGQVEFTAVGGRTYYLTLESNTWGEVGFTLNCTNAPEDCFNGVDDDANAQTDCDDTVCQDDPMCAYEQRCQPVAGFWLQCGDWVVGDTSGTVSTDAIDTYGGTCPGGDAGAPELVIPFHTSQDRSVTVQLDHPNAIDLDLYLLQGDCTPAACAKSGDASIGFEAVRDRVYLIAVDGPEGNAGTFDLRVTCD